MLRALRTMQFYSMTKDFGGDSVPEAYRSFAGQLDWVTLQFGSSWFVSSDDGNQTNLEDKKDEDSNSQNK